MLKLSKRIPTVHKSKHWWETKLLHKKVMNKIKQRSCKSGEAHKSGKCKFLKIKAKLKLGSSSKQQAAVVVSSLKKLRELTAKQNRKKIALNFSPSPLHQIFSLQICCSSYCCSSFQATNIWEESLEKLRKDSKALVQQHGLYVTLVGAPVTHAMHCTALNCSFVGCVGSVCCNKCWCCCCCSCARGRKWSTVQQQEHTVRLPVPFQRSDRRCWPVIEFFHNRPVGYLLGVAQNHIGCRLGYRHFWG